MDELDAIILMDEKCFSGDSERDHIYADNILCEFLESLGYNALVNKFVSVEKWYT